MVEVMIPEKTLKEIWAHTEWSDPFQSYLNDSNTLWEFLYLTERCKDVLKNKYLSVICDNEDANDILNLMTHYWCSSLIDDYISAHEEEVHEAFNIWWWSQHDISDYIEEKCDQA